MNLSPTKERDSKKDRYGILPKDVKVLVLLHPQVIHNKD